MIDKLPKCNGKPFVSICCECKEPLDEVSRLVIETRNAIEYTISHGYCKECKDMAMEDYRSKKELIAIRTEIAIKNIRELGMPSKDDN